jgi:hypothetical protein
MSWSLSRFPVDPRAEHALAAVGRALYIAAQFEDKCKYLLRVGGLAEMATGDPVTTLDDLIARLPEDPQLARTLKKLKRVGPVSAADAAILRAAREARNFIAHEAALFDIHQHPSGTLRETGGGRWVYDLSRLRAHLEELTGNVQRLARGDNLVSTWCFDLAEGRDLSRPYDLMEAYEAVVERWVLEPVRDLLVNASH